MTHSPCPFCSIQPNRVFHAGKHVLAIWDGFPISPGHALIITNRHISSWFDTSEEERAEILETIFHVRREIELTHKPDAYNFGINDGPMAGQTIPHLHLHVIPRYRDDVPDPRGGIRNLIPDRADYWSVDAASADSDTLRALVAGEDDPLLPHLLGHLDQATHVEIAVAFTLPSGVNHLEARLQDLLARGGSARFLTGDYLQVTDPNALQRLLDMQDRIEGGDKLELRMFEAKKRSFHPKAYIFHGSSGPQVAYVGSSNLTDTALRTGIEWNYRVVQARDSHGISDVVLSFNELWEHTSTRPLTQDWLDAYRKKWKPRPTVVEIPSEPLPKPPTPHSVQVQALAALEATRVEGNEAGLVVLATGLGKTWLSAFDSHRSEFRRVLFVAHRDEILSQALSTFRRIRPDAHLGKYTGQEKVRDAEVLFASIQTLGRQAHLKDFERDEFDYIVVDEFHHAAASTYRRLIDYFNPKFLLGLTATPERTDGGDLLALCQENLVFRKDLADGIALGQLCPFKYFGVPDEVDYSNIPWRSNRFDEKALTEAVATQKRANNVLEQYRDKGGTRTLGFCCSTRHADFMAEFFVGHGIRAVAVHSAPGSAPRTASLEELQAGDLDVIFTVDMFNEGVDLPNVDTILMLRPTESQILWLQQFGRGLRKSEGKPFLRVIDYIGNHRVFLVKPQTLLQLGVGDFKLKRALEQVLAGTFALPPGCEVTYDLSAIDILKGLLRVKDNDTLALFYEGFRDRHSRRPTATECWHEGYNPRSARRSHGSWLEFVRGQGDHDPDHGNALDQASEFLRVLETTPMTRSYKMLVLMAMLNEDAIPGSISIDRLVKECARIASRSAVTRRDIGSEIDDTQAIRKLLEDNPITAWVGGKGTQGKSYFGYQEGEFRFVGEIAAECRKAFQDLVREVVDWRLAEYRSRNARAASESSFVCKVSHAGNRPILFLPDRETDVGIPFGWTSVEFDGVRYTGNFVKVALNVVKGSESETNVLPDLLYGWFGEDAGRAGTSQFVTFDKTEDGYVAHPERRQDPEVSLEVGGSYTRPKAAEALGLEHKGRNWQTGFVFQDNTMVLFVTLRKHDMDAKYAYRDRFLTSDTFEWQSQNRTPQKGTTGERIKGHAELDIPVHLFVRREAKADGQALPFVYCGRLYFLEWKGEKPITVQWRVVPELTEPLQKHFKDVGGS